MRSAWLKIVIAVLVLAALGALAYRSQDSIHLANFSWSRLWVELAGTRKQYLLASLAGVYLAYLLRSLRWKRFCRYLGSASLGDVYGSTLMGFSALFVLGRAAEPIRPLLLARRCRMAVSGMFGIYVLERLFDTAATAVLAGSSLLLFRGALAAGGEWEGRIRAAGGALLVGLLVFAGFLVYFQMHGAGFLQRRLSHWRAVAGWRGFVATQFTEFSDGLQAIRGVSDWWAALAYSTLHWGLIVFIYLWVMRSFGGALGQLSFSSAMLVLAFTMMGSLVQLPGVGGGAQLAGFIALTKIFRIDAEPAAAVAVVTWLITFAGSCLVGLPLLIHEGLSMGELRRLASAEVEAETHGAHAGLPNAADAGPGSQPKGGHGAP
jgi:glycosyltransferase 2 family protein